MLARPVLAQALDDSLPAAIAGLPGTVAIASYLLAEGAFHDALLELAAPTVVVADPLGAHPAVARLILARFDSIG